jgi:hypothetical protein
MAHITNSESRSFIESVADRIGGTFAAIGRAFVTATEANSRIDRVQALNALSDEELAARGIRRDQIVHHVFRDLYYV